jgi:hypothetical protein
MDQRDDPEELLFLEDRLYKLGLLEGNNDGGGVSFGEGRTLGFLKGFELSREVGFYEGCLRVWLAFYRDDK